MAEQQVYWGTGRRKTAVARVRLVPGSGRIIVNGRDFREYLRRESLEVMVREPLALCEVEGKFDVLARVDGGGISGQAGAMRLGIARALAKWDESLAKLLRRNGLLTRDPRMKERKKYGQPGPRKQFQFSKR